MRLAARRCEQQQIKYKYRDMHDEIFLTSANRSAATAATALSPSHIATGLTGQRRAPSRRTAHYHTAPSLASRCRLMGS